MAEKTIAHYLSDLRLDLKDSGALWSDGELTRCVERAVSDLSRFLPDERSKEITVDATIDDESFTTPTAEDTDYFVTTWDISAVSDGTAATLAARRPDVPRPVKITVTDANTSITQLVIIVKGQDSDNRYIEEYFYLEGGLVQTGKKYFALVTAVEIDEIAGNGAADTAIIGTGDADGVYVQLAHKPIKHDSEAITGYERDSDYEMDYAGGRICMKDGGTLVANTAYTVDYTRSRIELDLDEYIKDLIRVDRIEYPVGQVPQTFSSVEVWGKILTLTGGADTQAEISDEEHLIVRYLAAHSAPGAQSPGSFPSFLDSTVELAASAYALFIYALKYEHQAATDLTAGIAELGNTTAVHTLAATALGKIINYLSDHAGADAETILENIATDVASLRTAINTAVDAANTSLDGLFTISVDKATTGAEAYLDTGDGTIPTVNVADRVPENYADYARARAVLATARLQAATGYVQEASARLANLQTYIQQANAWGEVAAGFAAEAAGHFNRIDKFLQEAALYIQTAQNDQTLADRFKLEAIERRNEAWAIWGSPHQIAPLYRTGQRGQVAR